MVLGKNVAFSIGNGAEIQPLEMGRKAPDRRSYILYMSAHVLFNLSNKFGRSDKVFGDKDSCRRKLKYVSIYTKIHRVSYMSAHVLLNLLNKLGKSNKAFGDKDSCRRK